MDKPDWKDDRQICNQFWIDNFEQMLFALEDSILLKITDIKLFYREGWKGINPFTGRSTEVKSAYVLIYNGKCDIEMVTKSKYNVDLARVKFILQDKLNNFKRDYHNRKMSERINQIVEYFTNTLLCLDQKTIDSVVDVKIYKGGIFNTYVFAEFLNADNKVLEKLEFRIGNREELELLQIKKLVSGRIIKPKIIQNMQEEGEETI